MTSPGLVSVDDYLRLTDDGRFEYVDGVLIERPMATWEHALLQVWIANLIMRLYPLYAAGSEEAEWRLSDTGRRARFYELTARGRKRLEEEENRWRSVTAAVAKVLRTV